MTDRRESPDRNRHLEEIIAVLKDSLRAVDELRLELAGAHLSMAIEALEKERR
jgi:hypothetical protein